MLPAVGVMVTAGQGSDRSSLNPTRKQNHTAGISGSNQLFPVASAGMYLLSRLPRLLKLNVLLSDIQIVPDLGSGMFLLVFPK